MKPIGGYFGLELAEGKLPYPNAVPVNFGRGGLELIVRTRNYHKVWIPDYICPVVPEYLDRLGVEYETYAINAKLEPAAIPVLAVGEAFLYVNYFGIKDAYCRKLEERFSTTATSNYNSLILDLTQAFYYEPTVADGFNSARKFFGVPDGGFVFGKGLTDADLPESISYDRCSALLHRTDGDVAGGYKIFKELDESFSNLSVARMSQLTRRILGSIDLVAAAKRRQANFAFLHAALASTNRLSSVLQLQLQTATRVPLVYPYFSRTGGELKKQLIAAKVFCPTYWPVIRSLGREAQKHVENMVCIPLDQRFGVCDMRRIVEEIHA